MKESLSSPRLSTRELVLSFSVVGSPETKGSTRAFVVKGRAVITNANSRAKSWQKNVNECAWAALTEMGGEPERGPVWVSLRFRLNRGKTVKREYPATRPDLDKLIRCVLDGLTGVAYLDDCQVVQVSASKIYRSDDAREGVDVEVWR